MAIFNLFSKRQKKLRGEILDVYSYSDAPQGLRVQIVHIVEDALGQNRQFTSANVVGTAYTFIHATLCREYGVFSIGNNNESDRSCVLNILLQTEDADKFIDVVE
ncbi:MAG TPA: hypothetical protein PLZ91_08710, partial [Bacteroidia bacterium]|nr:hypothetical protein [Bacteroidia bacterium]